MFFLKFLQCKHYHTAPEPFNCYLYLSVLKETTLANLRPDCYSARIWIRKAPHKTFFFYPARAYHSCPAG